jgi:hypothetical protein
MRCRAIPAPYGMAIPASRASPKHRGERTSKLTFAEGYDYKADAPLVAIKAVYLQLREAAELRLPFWG